MMDAIVFAPWMLDAMVGAILLACACVKGAKGLYKSLMPLVITVTAAVCALFLSAALTGPVTDVVYPTVENRVISAIHLDKIPEEAMEEFASYAAAPESWWSRYPRCCPTACCPPSPVWAWMCRNF